MNKAEFMQELSATVARVRLEKGQDACTVYCKVNLPKAFPQQSLLFNVAFGQCVRAEEGSPLATEKAERAWEIYSSHKRTRRSS